MAELHVITFDDMPTEICGSTEEYSIRPLSTPEIVSIEDFFFSKEEATRMENNGYEIILPISSTDTKNLIEYLTLSEFALSILTVSGYYSFNIVAVFSNEKCIKAISLPRHEPGTSEKVAFSNGMNSSIAIHWLQRCLLAKRNHKERMHIMAERYVRYRRSGRIHDGLLELCICLESLLDSQTEIAFKFGVCLAKITDVKGQEADHIANLLSDLYDVRSKLAHGDPSAEKALGKIKPYLAELHSLAKRILTTYVWYASEHNRNEWKAYLRNNLFN